MDNQNNPFSLGAFFIILLIGAMIGFQLGRWSNTQNILPYASPTLPPTEKVCSLEAKICPDGSTVGRVGPNCEFAPCPTPPLLPSPTANPLPISAGCVRAGCSSQLCVEPSEGDIVTTCEYREEYGCLGFSRCERQQDGQCGWTKTPEYSQCLTGLRKNL
ncbi:hypothetical protein A3F58_04015 [Candidatus Roizmanbacteria bacterium RIFCSPHIGHO2_12_FULL_37_9b]|uniref:Kazal-like domain-containing protein n=1 Tax=Candidatus Roizmanbacteria bacterium RIFCSPHIGHO2_02_FULL_38_11 TaxID=1802039 RepID=A0A1F7GYD4_9BACT|nr:MAG: hypothetical protein A3C25_05350 [Candidatus Roizmanbacteria bacterium RIFCSPHIGHO2_02_FULL_38_11]OGK32921.1 MAG: hypothetical protein A3F58_04015 [Candidatus Roizmanbacteria bacterium RIFCSPHIGHO2_12_FULL_37_9b]